MTKRTPVYPLAAIFLFLLCSLFLPQEDAWARDRRGIGAGVDSLMNIYLDLGEFSGAVLVADGSGILLDHGYGPANREWDLPNGPAVRYRIGSLTKQFTAALILRLVQDGTITLDSRLGDLLPWYRQDTGARVTVRQLLNHTSGIDRSGVPRMIRDQPCRPMSLREEVEAYCSGDLEWEPGSNFAYNNGGYLILGAVVEEVEGREYEQVLKERILGPAGMTDTGLYDPEMVLARRASGYDRTPEGLRQPPFVHARLAGSAGGLYSTTGDLYRWDRSLYGNSILSDSLRDAMFTPGLGRYGFGWVITSMPVGPDGADRKIILHPGQGDGFWSVLYRLPEDQIVLVLISNQGRTDLDAMAGGILDLMYGRKPKISIAAMVRHLLDTEGLGAAGREYRRLLDEEPLGYDVSEGQLNSLGYTFLSQGRNDAAVAVLKWNTETYPKSANAFDSLAEAQATVGDREGAMLSYRRALELDPEFEHAARMLEELESGRQEEAEELR